ncbi:LemA family protein [Alkalispirochaeta odontotermitis]|uniref:LemA family protein n=1 Tax=Olavius algarvensis spirochete endosymbiont TaxID=260710 RepID=UPI00052B8A5D|nr:LemA family protein [Olavius algarvensis spirochete endosymbiont]KGM42926.1 LemA family protein [Alkalispirochaeta odontotermitis]
MRIYRRSLAWIAILLPLTLSGCGYNRLVSLEEDVSAAWAQVENVYQRRMDLIPNLVETVKAYAAHEKETFAAVTEARSQAGGVMNIDENLLNNPEAFARFQQSQDSLGSALQRLLVITENYPELKANQNFLALQDQLEGTENRIAVERMRFNEAVRAYNTLIRRFPQMIIARITGFEAKPYFESTSGAEVAPKVEF